MLASCHGRNTRNRSALSFSPFYLLLSALGPPPCGQSASGDTDRNLARIIAHLPIRGGPSCRVTEQLPSRGTHLPWPVRRSKSVSRPPTSPATISMQAG